MAEDLFISYARADAAVVEALVGELRDLGYHPFFDSDLTGGQRWWDTLLDHIEAADVFLPVISQHYLDSEACYQESTWAARLGVPFLPVDVAQVDPQLCPRAIADANWVRYDLEGRSSLARLSHALRTIEPGVPVAVKPTRPAIPMTYFGELEREISGPLDWERQVVLIATLKGRLGSREDALARRLLRELQGNPRLSHASWREIEAALLENPPAPPVARVTARFDEPVAEPFVEPVAREPATPLVGEPSGAKDPVATGSSGSDVPPTARSENDGSPYPSPSRRTRLTIAAIAAIAVVAVASAAAGVLALRGGGDPRSEATGPGGGSTGAPAEDSAAPESETAVTPPPPPTAAELLEASQPTGVWRFHDYTQTKTTRAGETKQADPDDRPAKWTFTSNVCDARVCKGEIKTSRGGTYAYSWDGEQLKVPGWNTVDTDEWEACFDSSGNERPIDESSYRDTYRWTYGVFTGTASRLQRPWTERITTEFAGSCSAQSTDNVRYEGIQIITPIG